MNANLSRYSLSSYHWVFHLIVFIYVVGLFISNIDRGLDITDESYYILSTLYPNDSTAAVTQFGHYTNILYQLVRGDIGYFRLSGLLILLIVSGYFAISFQQYLKVYGFKSLNQYDIDYAMLITITLSSLAYYNIWLLTPSYNWLALIGSILVVTGILRAAKDSQSYHNYLLLWNSSLIGIGGSLAFFAKPTTALGLVFVFLYSSIALKFNKTLLRVTLISTGISLLFIIVHVIFFEDGFSQFVTEYKKGIILIAAHGAGHDIYDMLLSAYKGFSRIPTYMMNNMASSISVLFIPVFIAFIFRNILNRLNLLSTAIFYYSLIVIFISWFELLYKKQWVGGDNVGTYLAYPMLSFTIIIGLLCLFVAIVFSNGDNNKQEKINSIVDLYKHCFLLIFAAMAFSLGSNLGLVRRMSFAFVFIVPAVLVCAQWLDIKLNKTVILNVLSILLSISTALIINTSMENPQRLPMSVDHQTQKITFFDSNNEIFTDLQTQQYVITLKEIAREGGWEKGSFLIDLTGATPGAAVILNGRAPVTPWLIGGYPGSTDFVYQALSYAKKEILRDAWLLTAPNGKRKIDLSILDRLNLEFPNNYIKLGVITTGYRDEVQILWKPKQDVLD